MDARRVGDDPARDGEDCRKEDWLTIRLYLQSQAIWIQGVLMFDKTTGQLATGILEACSCSWHVRERELLAEIEKLKAGESGSVTFSRSEVEELREVVKAYDAAVNRGWFGKGSLRPVIRKLMGLSWPESKDPAQ